MGWTLADAEELLQTFNALLSIAQAEAGVSRDDWTEIDLAALGEDLADLYSAVAEDKGVALNRSGALNIRVWGNRRLLAQVVGNLLDNAVKYTPAGGQVNLLIERLDAAPAIVVADTGPGIPAEAREGASPGAFRALG